MLLRLLRDINDFKNSNQVSIHIFNDASEKDYKPCTDFLEQQFTGRYTYTRFAVNHGREQYWKLISTAFAALRNKKFDYLIQLPDDVFLVPGFFDRAVSYYELINDRNKICLNLLFDLERKGKQSWTSIVPSPVQFGNVMFYNTGWIDLCYIATPQLLRALRYAVDPVPEQWFLNKNHSSGVGRQISIRLYMQGYRMYQVNNSLVVHGDHPSQMHPQTREHHPLRTYSKPDTITASLASVTGREQALYETVSSVLRHVDHLHVYLNNYRQVPAFLSNPKIKVHTSQKHGDLGDAGKFFPSAGIKGYHFTLDDDLIYPPDYFPRMINAIERYRRRCVISAHGRQLKSTPLGSYYRGGASRLFRCLGMVTEDVPVHVAGTGVMAYHTDTIRVDISDFRAPNMADIWFALKAQEKKIPLIVIAHDKGWITHSDKVPADITIAHTHRYNDGLQTDTVNSIKWHLHEATSDTVLQHHH